MTIGLYTGAVHFLAAAIEASLVWFGDSNISLTFVELWLLVRGLNFSNDASDKSLLVLFVCCRFFTGVIHSSPSSCDDFSSFEGSEIFWLLMTLTRLFVVGAPLSIKDIHFSTSPGVVITS